MDVVTACGLPVASLLWQAPTGAWALTAVCKATFRLVPGVVTLTSSQEPPNDDDNHWNDDESRSLQATSDLAPFKPRADVLVVGQAFAPGRLKVRSLSVRLSVAGVDKGVEVWCDRWFEMDGRIREGAPFSQMPLRYERAAGGPDTTNPVGMSFEAAPDRHGRCPIPNLQPLGAFVAHRGDRFSPVGLGPLAPHWPERAARLPPRMPVGWHRKWSAQPLPQAMDPAYFNVAPLDQQTDYLRPDERIVLENLHAEHPRLVTRLPGWSPHAVVERATGHRARMELVADTLWIDTDQALCTVVWRGRIGLTHPQEQGRIVFVCDGLTEQAFEAMPPSSGDPAGPGAALSTVVDERDVAVTLVPGLDVAGRAVLPFETSRWAQSRMAKPSGELAPRRDGGEDAGGTVFLLPTSDAAMTLPFVKDPSAPEPPAPPAFEPPPASPAGPSEAFRIQSSITAAGASHRAAPVARPGFGADDTQQAPLVVMTEGSPAPPPMIGPLATPEMASSKESVSKESIGAASAEKPIGAVVAEPQGALVEPGKPTIEDYPIDRCARIAARVACAADAARVAEVLREEELDAAGWEMVHEHWLAAMRKRAERRDKEMMSAYDRAYVGELEVQRGMIAIEDYARLAEAAERGAQVEALAARGLPAGAWANIHRVWIERMIKDAPLAGLVRRAMGVQRDMA